SAGDEHLRDRLGLERHVRAGHAPVPPDDVDAAGPERGVLREPPLDSDEVSIILLDEHRAFHEQNVLPSGRDRERGQAVLEPVVLSKGVVRVVEPRTPGLALAPHLRLRLESSEEHAPPDVARSAFGGHLVPEAAGRIDFSPDVHPGARAEMLIPRLHTAQRPVRHRPVVAAGEEALEEGGRPQADADLRGCHADEAGHEKRNVQRAAGQRRYSTASVLAGRETDRAGSVSSARAAPHAEVLAIATGGLTSLPPLRPSAADGLPAGRSLTRSRRSSRRS